MIRGSRRKLAAVAAVLGLGIGSAVLATSASAAPVASAPSATPIGQCASGALAAWVGPERGDGAAGSIFYPLDFTNISSRTCTLQGFPGVSATTLGGKQLGNAASRDNGVPNKVVVLAPHATAHATLRYVDVQIDPSAACKQTPASLLKIFPPDQRTATSAFFSLPVCSVRGRTYLTIRRIQPGV
jgi:hypothetical protein